MRGVMKMVLAATAAGLAVSARAQCLDNVPHTTGTWQTLSYQMPINPISTTMLRDGRILIVSGSENDASNNHTGADTYRVAVWDPTVPDASGFLLGRLPYDVFCSGAAQLPHGLVLITGGSADYGFTGESRGTFFDPATNEFFQSQKMTDGRWYGTASVLGDGRLLALSGLNGGGSTTNRFEIYNVNSTTAAGWTAPVTETFTPPLFPRSFLLPNGKLFYSGHGSGTSNSRGYLYDPVANSWSNSALTDANRNYGTVVLLPLYPPSYATSVIALGGGGSPALATTKVVNPSTATASTIWSDGPNMVTGRIELGAVLLPNGKLLVHGGSLSNETPDTLGKKAEIYDPATNAFPPEGAGTAAYSRLYHSTSLLLPDARVVSMGGNSGNRGRYLGAIEIYTPSYLYDADDRLITTDRPHIVSAPTGPLGYNAGFAVDYTSSSAIASAVLVRPGAVTHAFDMEQRMVGLCGPAPQPACSGSGGTLNLTTPPNGNVAPPGFYMLFLLDAAGVPSVAKFIELSPYSGAPPDGVITSPANDMTINAGQTVNFGTSTNATKYNWLFPGGATTASLPYSTLKNPGNVTYSTAGEHYATLIVGGVNGDTDPSPSVRRIHVLPASADFKLAVAQDARTIAPGQSTTYSVTLTPIKGFTGVVSFSVESEGGIPSGVSVGGFSPPSLTGSGTTTLTINTTTSAVPYALSLTVHGNTATVGHTTSTSLLINPPIPEGLVAGATSGQVQLSWLPSTGANGYEVRRSLAGANGFESIACTASTSYTDTNVVNGIAYDYLVVATYAGGPAAGGASAPSGVVSATPPCPTPGYDGLLSVSKSGADALYDWTAGGASAYDLIRGDLSTLRSTGGDFQQAVDALPAAEGGCLVNDTTSLSLADPYGAPALGEGIFTLIRPATIACSAHGTVDDGSPSQVADRDAQIESAALSCP